MATIKKIEISRNWATRPNNNWVYDGYYWLVEKGEPYDLVQFSINELGKPYFWNTSLCVKSGMNEEDIKALVEEYVSSITEEDIKSYRNFLESGERWGWD